MLDAIVGPDPADAQTLDRTTTDDDFGPRRTYRAGLSASALKGARIGVVRGLFGATPDDQEVSGVVNRALDAMKMAGADVSDVVIPGLDDLLRDSSMIAFDFKFDLMEYLARAENPPVHSLGEILDRGLYHSALESTFRTRNATETRETDGTRRARIKQATLRQVTEALLNEQRLDALVYPALRRRPARLGEAQGGTNCQLSAHSGLPALSVPAGFTADGVPIGMELLGGAFSEPRLLSLGYSIEQTLQLRHAPFSTPALAGGKPPAPRTTTLRGAGLAVALAYDVTTSRLDYTITPEPKVPLTHVLLWLHTGTAEKPGAARHRLVAPAAAGVRSTGSVTLTSSDRDDLEKGHLLLRFFTAAPEPVTVAIPPVQRWP
jgi:hypothetical protein